MSLSRTHRPGRFSDITGQDTITETLRKQVAGGQTAHAYLFSGPRGVGKTTSARVLAKALNCENPKDGEPCSECASCRSISEGSSIDIIEIDAASHNGVDNVREAILEHVRFTPVKNRYKIYILDEAHMLTGPAWNAMLKTLEEPPEYALFIFATTELHKIPLTILSRCQRYDFKRINPEVMAIRINDLAKLEKVKIEPTVVSSIVRHAEGCVRDAETLLGQMLALGEKDITADVAGFVIPLSRVPRAVDLLSACSSRSLHAALAEVIKLEEDGVPLLPFFDDCLECVRHLLLAAEDPSYAKKIADGYEGSSEISRLVGAFSAGELSDIALLFMERRRDAKQGIDARFALELAVTPIALALLPNARRNETSKPPEPPKQSPPPAPEPINVPISTGTPLKKQDGISHRNWLDIIEVVSEDNASLSFILSTVTPISYDGSTLTLRFRYAFHKEKLLLQVKNKQVFQNAVSSVLGNEKVVIEAVIGEEDDSRAVSTDPVSKILHIFDGKLVDGQAES
jgi:DNA polymerase-3 subunit gamma/tau